MSEGATGSKPPAVLVIDDEFRTDLYRIWLHESYTVRTASSLVEGLSQIDPTVAVVVLRHELSAEVKSDIETRLDAVAPSARIALTTSDDVDVTFSDVEFDASIREPITADKLNETVGTLLQRARYHEALKRYYQYTLRSTNMEIEASREGRSDDDEADTIHEQITEYRNLLDELGTALNRDDKKAVLDSLRPKPAFPRSMDVERPNVGKYVPDTCRNCGLAWGTDHGGDLGKGYEPIGAFTWRCTNCGTVRDVPNPTGRQVARRRY